MEVFCEHSKPLQAEQAGIQLIPSSAAISGAIKTSKLPEANAVDVTCKWQPRSYKWIPRLTSPQGEHTTYCSGTGEPNTPSLRVSLLIRFQMSRAETFLVILCGSIPALKPIYDMCLRRQQASSRALFSIPRRPTYRPKKSFPSLSTGDDSYVQLEPIQKHSARPTVMEVARPANIVGGSQSTGGNATTALHEPHRATGERTASEGAVGAHETEQSRVRWPAANAFRGGDMV